MMRNRNAVSQFEGVMFFERPKRTGHAELFVVILKCFPFYRHLRDLLIGGLAVCRVSFDYVCYMN